MFKLILPILVLLSAELYAKVQIENRDTKFMVSQRPLNLTQAVYGNNTQFYYGLWDNTSAPIKYLDALVKDPGPGLRCTNGVHLRSFGGFVLVYLLHIIHVRRIKDIQWNVIKVRQADNLIIN